ncbi:precorrin-6Y C5,15-methyltransferase (decarboxylating) subunit CbiT [Mitsuokella jalaludinii]|uniref:precorrin-6Y C5,15-methyltransferase (decarboxylating) subunit CbiT n=1 Tax=Mitsuokella jalaludinii TaxID=187979 RepID=UPI0022E0B926|nr:precorrin-6Y C5,15-methyltransferase (decarboxylating) subunit CbiT [Mitsuokella jalaludinii]MCI6607631.1 precorrin-6Y C5,15-methyltransferase (decarboxylating) subunit CbiT [Mitsuokella jalaludinii]MCI6612277.1 precorrin-6Y C5,15-methyltransferase (decarboxylating) subunit CbiT [Mitsuokella jalaludinii]MCI7186381.1 precorrin-6Y C5,15-methyltransferase (decarboxylating) subunit CbiT [Mitsuokella jalaludinii]MDD7744657.1 precorrin-6Y C5,15-methyltransferase (decarboxylating) subunit CbiT [Mit
MKLGLPDAAFVRGKVPMTKQEIRILTLVKAQIGPRDIVYDIGAGTGSLSIEAARLAPEGHVYAVERKEEAIRLIEANGERFGLENLSVIEAEAPAGLENLPLADAVLIGGSGGHLASILDCVAEKLREGGRLVLNCITVQTLAAALDYLHAHEAVYRYEAIQVQVSRLRRVGPYDMADAQNPVYIITCTKEV